MAKTSTRYMRSCGQQQSSVLIGPSCTRCGETFARRTRAGGLIDQLLAFARVTSFRCQVCANRFRAFQWRSCARHAPDPRQYQRIPTNVRATFFDGRTIRKGGMVALSMGGCTMKVGAPLAEGAFVALRVWPPDQIVPIEVSVATIRSVRSTSVGLQFLEFNPGEQDRLSRFVHSLLHRQLVVAEAGA